MWEVELTLAIISGNFELKSERSEHHGVKGVSTLQECRSGIERSENVQRRHLLPLQKICSTMARHPDIPTKGETCSPIVGILFL